MAIVLLGKTKCQLCDEAHLANQPTFATSGCWLPQDHPLGQYCDASFHWRCYLAWERRPEFARAYVDSQIAWHPQDPNYGSVYRGSQIYLAVSLSHAVVWFYSTGRQQGVALADWERGLLQSDLHEFEWHDWLAEAPVVQASFPSAQALTDQVDWEEKHRLHDAFNLELRSHDTARNEAVDKYNAQMDALQDHPCPRCGHDKMRYLDRRGPGTGSKSCFICPTCGRSAHLQDLQVEA